ncbi:MAG TPA: ribose-5-phosphate isomerase RpiA [Puia sp.]|nr:ribose-5-phosphate isomerase RpiA [Puia sp.]
MSDLKQQAALAAVKLVKENSIVGFGAGSTIACLVNGIKTRPELAGTITTVTSSYNTRLLLQQSGFAVREMGDLQEIDVYFDGCDQFDVRLNALKSGGGIHTREKILASMAREFVLIGDASKYVEKLDGKYPLVVEVIPDALAFVMSRLQQLLNPSECRVRMSDKKDGAVITENGNYLLDCRWTVFPDPELVNEKVIRIPGVLEHSLFFNIARLGIIAGADGIKIIR